MRSSPPRSTPLTLVTKEPSSAAAASAPSEQASRESAPVGTDLSLPKEIAGPLASGLQAEKYKSGTGEYGQEPDGEYRLPSHCRALGNRHLFRCASLLRSATAGPLS